MLELSIFDNKTEIFDRTVFLRADLDVPLKSQISNLKSQMVIGDDTRLLSWMPTLQFLLDNGAKVIIAGHLGRPEIKNQESPLHQGFEGQARIRNHELSLRPVAQWFAKRFHNSSFMLHDSKLGEFDGWEIMPNLFLLENLRFYEGEEENNLGFAKKLASLADMYVNDAFAVSHRNHASIVGVPKFLPHFAGLRLQKEVEVLGSVLENPVRPLVVIIGGAKIETKLSLVETMCNLANHVLIGGKIARESDTFSKIMVKKPVNKAKLLIADLNKDKTDITQKSLSKFLKIIKDAKTIVWNGPVGLINSEFRIQNSELGTEKGTVELARGIVKSEAYTIAGGGDTLAFLRKIHLINKFSFVSTGGGAMLAFLSQKNMPGLQALISPNK